MTELQKVFDGSDFEPFAYSGRGMYGKYCLAFRVSDLASFIAEIVANVQDGTLRVDHDDIRSMKVDNLGRDTVVYFPYIEFVDTEEEEEEV